MFPGSGVLLVAVIPIDAVGAVVGADVLSEVTKCKGM